MEVLDESFAKEICERQSRNLLTEDDLSKMLDEHFQRVQVSLGINMQRCLNILDPR